MSNTADLVLPRRRSPARACIARRILRLPGESRTRSPPMIRSLAGLAVAFGLTLSVSVPAVAAPPQINAISPFGARRGAETELTVSGANLGGSPRLVAPFGFAVSKLA